MASIAFTDCSGVTPIQGSSQPAPRRREVVVNGRRVKTVDVHAHCVIPETLTMLGLKPEAQRRGLVMVVADRVSEMDEQGIDVEALSINPFWYKAERDLATQVIRIQNEKLAELCAARPDRFVAFASVALQYPDLAVQQLGVLIFIHPQSTPDLAKRLKGNGWLLNVIGNPLDTTIALSHLIFEGTLDRFPGLKICAAHGGGYLPSYA